MSVIKIYIYRLYKRFISTPFFVSVEFSVVCYSAVKIAIFWSVDCVNGMQLGYMYWVCLYIIFVLDVVIMFDFQICAGLSCLYLVAPGTLEFVNSTY